MYFARDTDSSSSVSNTSTTLLLVASINDDDVADRMQLKTGMDGEKLRDDVAILYTFDWFFEAGKGVFAVMNDGFRRRRR